MPATLLVSPVTVVASGFGSSDAWVPAPWRAPDHRVRRGLVELGTAARAGQQIRVWTDPAGQLTGPPVSRRAIQSDVTLAVLITPVALALVLLMTGYSVRLLLNRRRLADWEQAWAAVGPRWTPQP